MRRSIYSQLKFVIKFIMLLWLIHGLSYFFPLQIFGIIPREPIGLIGVLTAPLLHGSIDHLSLNSFFILVFGSTYSVLEGRGLQRLMLRLTCIAGIMTWLIGKKGIHIGASGLIFGLYAHLMFMGFFHRSIHYILVSITILFFYGSFILGVFPSSMQKVSWEAHLCGFIAGIVSAKYKLHKA